MARAVGYYPLCRRADNTQTTSVSMHVLSKCQRLIPLDYGVVVEYAARTMAIIESTYKIFDVVTREWQAKAIDSLVAGNDLFVRAGTGCGKSLVYQSMTTAKPNGIVLVLAPLKSLMNDQVTPSLPPSNRIVHQTHEKEGPSRCAYS